MNDIGVGYYRKTASPNILDAIWTTSKLSNKGLGTGVVQGDWSQGFAGRHTVTYYLPDGTNAGAFDLRIERNPSGYRMLWSQEGKAMYEGIGIETPEGLSIGFAKKPE